MSDPATAPGVPPPLPWTRGERRELGLLFLAAVLLRVAYVLALRRSPVFDAPVLDPAFHVEWARALARGETFAEGPFFRAPLYVWFLAAVLKLGGGGLLVPRLVQALLGGATAVLTYVLAREAFDRRVARLAGWGAATYWVLVYFDGELLIPTLAIPLDLAALCATQALARAARPRTALLAGLAWGASALARPNVLLLPPAIALWLVLGRDPRRWRAALALALGSALPVLPVSAYNAFVGGDFALVSTQAGVNLWIGNHPGADGHTPYVPGTSGDDFEATFRGAHELAERVEGRPLRPSEVSAHYAARARAFWREEPGRAAALLLRKLGLFWRADELGNNQPVRFTAFHFAPLLAFTPLRFAWLAPLGLLGAAVSLRRRWFPLWGFLALYCVGVVAFFVCSRFRAPVLPVLCVLAARALVWGRDRWRSGARARVSFAGAAAAFGVLASLWLAPERRVEDAAGELFLANAYEAADDPRAAEHYRRAVDLDPTPVARTYLAAHLENHGDPEGARAELTAAYAAAPLHPRIVDAWLGFLLRAGDDAGLAAACAEALMRTPELSTVHYHQGAVHLRAGRGRKAEEELREARRLEPGASRAQAALGSLLARRGDGAGALELLEEALEHGQFENASRQEEEAWRLAVRVARELGELDRARALAAACALRHPGSALARDLAEALR